MQGTLKEPAPKDKANGAAVLVCPGGGFSQLSFNGEGLEPARYFTNLGVAGYIVGVISVIVAVIPLFSNK